MAPQFKSSLFFLALLGLGAFGSSYATPYIPRQGSNHIQSIEPNQQQEEEFRLAAPLQQQQLPAAPLQPVPASPSPSTELQQSPPRVEPTTNVEPMDQEVGSTEVIVQTLTEDERGNLVSYLICEMCRELQVSMCVRMCDGEGNGTQAEAGGNSTAQEDDSIAAALGDSEDGEAGNSTASAANSTLTGDEEAAGNGTQSTAQEDDSLFNVLGGEDASEESGNATSAEAAAGGNSTESGASSSEEFGQSGNSTLIDGEQDQAASNGTQSQGSQEEGSIFNDLGDVEASGQAGNATVSEGNENGNNTLSSSEEVQGGNGTEAATGNESEAN